MNKSHRFTILGWINARVCAAPLLLLIAATCFITPAQAQIAFRAAGVQTVSTGSSITPAIPAGTQAGDFAVLVIAGRPSDTSQPAAPSGWTYVARACAKWVVVI